jgi:hypothetical protein
MTYDPSDAYPRIEAACVAVKAAMALIDAARDKSEQRFADRAAQAAEAKGVRAYATDLLPIFASGKWRPSADHAHDPDAILDLPPHQSSLCALFDHPLVFRRAGSHGADSYKNTVIIGRPYPIRGADTGQFYSQALDNAAWLAERGWRCWWHRDLSTWYPGWTQLVVAKHLFQQPTGIPAGFIPIIAPHLGVGVAGHA